MSRTRWLLPLLLSACNDDLVLPSGTTGGDDLDAILALQGDPVAGRSVFGDHCEICHDPAGSEDRAGPALTNLVPTLGPRQALEVMLNGKGTMPAVQLEDQDAADTLAWLDDAFGLGEGGPSTGDPPDTDDTDVQIDAATTYADNCAACHGTFGEGSVYFPALDAARIDPLTDAQLRSTISNGQGDMPAFAAITGEELDALIAWLRSTFGS